MAKAAEKKNSGQQGLARDRRGLSTVEYIIILALIAVAAITAWDQFGQRLQEVVNSKKDAIGDLESND